MLRKTLYGFGYAYLVLMLYRVVVNTCLFSISEEYIKYIYMEIYQNF